MPVMVAQALNTRLTDLSHKLAIPDTLLEEANETM